MGEVKTMDLKKSAEETLLAMTKKSESRNDRRNKKLNDIKKKAGQAL